jgi:hypothetical protein
VSYDVRARRKSGSDNVVVGSNDDGISIVVRMVSVDAVLVPAHPDRRSAVLAAAAVRPTSSVFLFMVFLSW